jgi:hypothetical protein
MEERKTTAASFLGVNVKDFTPVAPVEPITGGDTNETGSKTGSNLHIDNLEEVIARVKEENEQRKLNPSTILDGEAGINFIDGEPYLVIDGVYIPHKEAVIILKTRNVVREYLKLENLKKGIIEE